MNILYIAHNHPPSDAPLQNIGGMQRVSMNLLDELNRRQDHRVESIIQQTSWKGIGIKTLFFLLKLIIRLPSEVKRSNADVILFSSMVTASLAYFVRNRVNIPMVTINHGQDVTLPVGLYQWFIPYVFRALDGVISVSSATRQQCIERGMLPEKGVALPNGFDLNRLDEFPPKEDAIEKLKHQFGIKFNNRFILLSVGRQVKRKGHEWFIRNVLPLLKSDIIYITIGDGPEEDNIREAVDKSELSEHIYMLGRQPDLILKYAYAAADLFIMPNIPVAGDMEGFGIVILEANMARTPAIASNLEGIKDVITQGENGFRVPPMEPRVFAEKIDKTLNNNLSQLSEKSREFTMHRFSWEHVARQYLLYIEEVIKQYQ